MRTKVNLLNNPTFSLGARTPSSWDWSARGRGATWTRTPIAAATKRAKPGTAMELSLSQAGTALWHQIVKCKPADWYRVEVVAACDLTPLNDDGGLILELQTMTGARATGSPLITPPIRRSTEATTIRAYWQAPPGTRRARIAVGIWDASGTARLQEVRFIRIIEPEEDAHILAVPPPPSAYPVPLTAQRICVVSDGAESRPLTRMLTEAFGASCVTAMTPERLTLSKPPGDALLLLDDVAPPAIKSLNSLLRLSAQRIVVISTSAFAGLSRGKLSLRRIEQDDDPIHARIVQASYATHGFALHDAIPYASVGRRPGSFVQRHFRRTPELARFCKRHALDVMLESLCDRDATSHRPIALQRIQPQGALFVIDLEPLEATPSTMGETMPAVHMLCAMLGRNTNELGQYIVAHRTEGAFRWAVREFGARFSQFVVHDQDVPATEVTEQLITLGGEGQTLGRPQATRPLLLIRSGLTAGDMESIYGVFVWFKQLVRPTPEARQHADALATQFRVAWVPSAAPWEGMPGWQRSGRPGVETMLDMEDGGVAALIDVVSRGVQRVQIVLNDQAAAADGLTRRLRTAPKADRTEPFVFGPESGAEFSERDGFAWRRGRPTR